MSRLRWVVASQRYIGSYVQNRRSWYYVLCIDQFKFIAESELKVWQYIAKGGIQKLERCLGTHRGRCVIRRS
jgi:hypothetical protein